MGYVSTKEAVLTIVLHQLPDGGIVLPLTYSGNYQEPMWRIPGGEIEEGEWPFIAGARELSEKTGLVVLAKNMHQRGIIEKPSCDGGGIHYQYVFICEADSIEGFLPRSVDEAENLANELFPLGEVLKALKLQMSLHGHRILPVHAEILKKELFPLFDHLLEAA